MFLLLSLFLQNIFASAAAFTLKFLCVHENPTLVFSVKKHLSYRDSGVDIEAGESLIDQIKSLAGKTSRLGCTAELGMFGGLFDVKAAGYLDPLLVSGTDGVGTKLKVRTHISEWEMNV